MHITLKFPNDSFPLFCLKQVGKSTTKKIFLIVAVLFFLDSANSFGIEEKLVVPGEGTTMLIGTGYNSVTGRVLDRCMLVSGNEQTKSLVGDAGSVTHSEGEEIGNRKELSKKLSLNASASLGFGPFSASAESQFFNGRSFNSHSYYLAEKSIVKNQSETLIDFKVKPEAKKLAATNPEKFLQVCGDSFIAARVTGGIFLAVLVLETTSAEEKRNLSASFEAKYNLVGGGGSYGEEVKQIISMHKGIWKFFRAGAVDALPDPSDPQSIKKYALGFSTKVNATTGKGIPYTVTIKSYDDLLDMADVKLISLTSSREVLEDLSTRHSQALQLHNDILYILSNKKEFKPFNEKQLESNSKEVAEILNELRSKASLCEKFPTDTNKCKFLPASELQLPQIALPAHDKVIYKLDATLSCGVKGYETKNVPRQCRHQKNGKEIVEKRTLFFTINHAHWSSYWRHINPKSHALNVCNAMKSKPERPWNGYDSTWALASISVGNYKTGNTSEDGTGSDFMDVQCQAKIERKLDKFGPNEACGVEVVEDRGKPIFNSCRHWTHGVEK